MRFPILGATTLLILASSLSGADAAKRAAQAPDSYDGAWSIEVITEDGPCDRAYRYSVQIRKGEASYPGGDFDVSGRVGASGAVRARISRGTDGADVVGRLERDGFGTGTWRSAGSIRCRGRWNAERRG